MGPHFERASQGIDAACEPVQTSSHGTVRRTPTVVLDLQRRRILSAPKHDPTRLRAAVLDHIRRGLANRPGERALMCRINVGAVPLDGDSDARGTKRSVGSCELGLDAWQMRTSHSLTDIADRLTRKPLDIRELG